MKDSNEKELLKEIKNAAPEDKAEKTQELLDYFNSKKSSKKKKPVGRAFSGVKSSLKGGRKSTGGLGASSVGSSTGGPIAAGTGASVLSFGTLLGKKIGNAFQNAKEEKERAQQAESAGAELPDEVKEKGYFIKKALGYEFGGRAFDTTFGNFVASMPAKQSAGNAKFSDQFDYGENDPKNKGKEKTLPEILGRGFRDVSKAFAKVSDRLTTQNNLLKSVLDQSVTNGELLEKIKDSISALNALEMQSDEEDMQQMQDQPDVDASEDNGEAQPQQGGLDILDILGSVDDALDIAKNLKGKKTKRRSGVRRRATRRKFGRMFGKRVKLAAGGFTPGGVPAMLGEAGPELVTNRFMGPSAFGVGGIKGGEYLGLAQPLATAMEMPIKATGGIMLSNMGGFLRASGPMGGALAPMFASLAMPMSGIFGISQSMIKSTIFGGVSSLQDSADYITNIFKNVFGILNLKSLIGGGDDEGGGSPPGPPGPGKVIQGGDADFWSLAAVASLEGASPQGEADVAQVVYNRVASGAYSVKTIKDAILSPGQFQPVTYDGADLDKWKAIKDRESAIAAVATHKGKGVQTATKYVDEGAANITNQSLQRSAAEFVGGRTDFAVPSAANKYPGGFGYKERHGHLFGWYVGPGSIAYGKTNPGPASVPNFPIKAQSGVNAAPKSSGGAKYTIISGPDSGYQVPGDLVNGANVEGHGQELVQTTSSGFKIYPLENNKYSLSTNPKPLIERWGEISGNAKVASKGTSYQARGGGGLSMPRMTPLYHGTSGNVGRLINQGGFRPSASGMLGPGVYASRSRQVADSYRGAGALKGLVRGQGPRLQMIAPAGAGRTFRGATALPTKTANKGYNLAKKLNAGAYPKSARANMLREMLRASNRAIPAATQSAGWMMKFASAAKKLNVPGIITEVFNQSAADGTLDAAMRDPRLKKYMQSNDQIVPVIINQPASKPPVRYSSPTSQVTPDYRKMSKNNAMLRYS